MIKAHNYTFSGIYTFGLLGLTWFYFRVIALKQTPVLYFYFLVA